MVGISQTGFRIVETCLKDFDAHGMGDFAYVLQNDNNILTNDKYPVKI